MNASLVSVASRSPCSSCGCGLSRRMSAPPPTYEAAPGSPLAATVSPNLPSHPPSSTARPTTSGLLLEQVCADVRRDPHSTPRPSPPNLCLSLRPYNQRPPTDAKGAGTAHQCPPRAL